MTPPPPPQPALSALIRDINALSAAPPTNANANARRLRDLQARARRLRRADLLPTPTPTPTPPPAPTPIRCADPEVHDPTPVIEAKARSSQIPAAILREVYCRALTSTEPLPPHLTRVSAAHARVNTFIRLSQGDFSARDDDADLLSRLNY